MPVKKNFLSAETAGTRGLWLWLLLHLGIPALLVISIFPAGTVRVNTMLLDMLPRPGNSRAAAEADAVLGERTSREAVVFAVAADFETAKNGAAELAGTLGDSGGFENITLFFDSSVMAEFAGYLHDYRFVIAGKETRVLLEGGRADEIAADALAAAFGAFTLLPLDNIATDPFLLAQRRMNEYLNSALLSGGNLSLADDVLAAEKNGKWYVLLRLTLAPGAVSVQKDKNAVAGIYDTSKIIKQKTDGLEFYFSGVPFHSYESSSGAQREISIISTVTLAVILALFLYVFRSLLPVLLSVLAAGFSLGLASAAALLVFREIHIITFVFGTTLIGTCVDYSVHFFVHWKGNSALKNGNEIRSKILKSITMSFISTEICFSVFLFAPFPILKQFAVFSMTGLLSSYLTALFVYPLLKIPSPEKRRLILFSRNAAPAEKKRRPRPPVLAAAFAVLAVCAAVIAAVNAPSLKIKNDITSLYAMSPFLLESEKQAAAVMNYGSPGWYFIVSGASADETLEHEEALLLRLEEEISRGNLGSVLGTSAFVPPICTQKKNYEAMKALLPLATAQFDYLGFPPETAEAFIAEFAAAGQRYCLPENAPAAAGIGNLWIGEKNGSWYSCVMPFHPGDERIFRDIAAEFDFVHFMNKAKDVGNDLDTLTKTMLVLFAAAWLVVSALVFFVYPRRTALKISAVPVFLVLAVLAALALSRIPPGFFSAAALVLVFGLGLDYIFYMAGKKEENGRLTPLAVTLSFLTTMLSFGALALSSFVPVHIFGLVVSAGLGAAFIAAMLLQG